MYNVALPDGGSGSWLPIVDLSAAFLIGALGEKYFRPTPSATEEADDVVVRILTEECALPHDSAVYYAVEAVRARWETGNMGKVLSGLLHDRLESEQPPRPVSSKRTVTVSDTDSDGNKVSRDAQLQVFAKPELWNPTTLPGDQCLRTAVDLDPSKTQSDAASSFALNSDANAVSSVWYESPVCAKVANSWIFVGFRALLSVLPAEKCGELANLLPGVEVPVSNALPPARWQGGQRQPPQNDGPTQWEFAPIGNLDGSGTREGAADTTLLAAVLQPPGGLAGVADANKTLIGADGVSAIQAKQQTRFIVADQLGPTTSAGGPGASKSVSLPSACLATVNLEGYRLMRVRDSQSGGASAMAAAYRQGLDSKFEPAVANMLGALQKYCDSVSPGGKCTELYAQYEDVCWRVLQWGWNQPDDGGKPVADLPAIADLPALSEPALTRWREAVQTIREADNSALENGGKTAL